MGVNMLKKSRTWIEQHPVVAYFILAYAFSWSVCVVLIAGFFAYPSLLVSAVVALASMVTLAWNQRPTTARKAVPMRAASKGEFSRLTEKDG